MKAQPARTERASTTPHDAAEFSFSSGALYADKDEYVSKNLTFTIGRVEFQEKSGFDGADRWAIYVQPNDGRPEEIITLQSNENRDAELQAAAAHVEKRGPIKNTKLVKSGKAYYFRNATETKTQ
ncbi:MAG TPA: hypothetical protein VFE16_01260 [Candidatus Cybelea sp.]|jgi:hypothetical protein|nr:hypothetical protein [Candidatus Cybelea sp.]